jgi:hypothetical protein
MNVLRQDAKDISGIVAGWASLLLLAFAFSMERSKNRPSGTD